jgi:pimeloyl-ACP methyl ester carboxylesterase
MPGLGTRDSGLDHRAGETGAFFAANGALLYYKTDGAGEPLVMLHGWALNLRMFDPQIPALAREFRVVRMDRRGFGRSSDAEDVSWDGADLEALLDFLRIPRAHMLAMSQGAVAALALAVAHPDRVASLILQGPVAPRGFGLSWSGPDRWPKDEYAAIARGQGVEAVRRVWLAHPMMRVPDGREPVRAKVEALVAEYRGGMFLSPVEPSGPRPPVSMSDLKLVQAPTLVLTGEEEVPYFRIVADAMAYAIRGAERIVLPGGAHLINLIEPDRFNQAVIGFLRRVAGASSPR